MTAKNLIAKLDGAILGGILSRIYVLVISEISVKWKNHILNHGFAIQYKKDDTSLLNFLADKYGSDKGGISFGKKPYNWSSHNYVDFYNLAFGLRRNDVKCVVECGLGTNNPSLKSSMGIDGKPGASLRMWRDYFPSAHVFGCDIDVDILFDEERITTFYCDQTSPDSIQTFVSNAGVTKGSVDIIIDDGLHEFHGGICFFENTIDYLRRDGLYIIEDVTCSDIVRYKNYFCDKSERFDARFAYFKSPSRKYSGDDNLICITQRGVA